MHRSSLEVDWEVDEPSLGFAERVIETATGEGFEALDRTSGMVPRFVPHGSPSSTRAFGRALATGVAVAAAAAVLCLFGASTGQVSGRAESQEELARYGYPESLVDLRTTAGGGNTADNPEAGATGLW